MSIWDFRQLIESQVTIGEFLGFWLALIAIGIVLAILGSRKK